MIKSVKAKLIYEVNNWNLNVEYPAEKLLRDSS